MKKINNKCKYAFTLAEMIAVLMILGVLAAITLPTTLKKTTERQNKTKVAKAIATYDKLIQTFTIENQINISTDKLNELARYDKMALPVFNAKSTYTKGLKRNTDEYNAAVARYTADKDAYDNEINSGECENIRKYFNIQDYSFKHKEASVNVTMPTKCMFKSGGLWWDVTNISKTIIATKPEVLVVVDKDGKEVKKNPDIDSIAMDYDDKRAFYLNTTKNKNGSYKTNEASKNDFVDVQIQNFKAYDYAFNKQSISYLMCNQKRTTDCANSSSKGYHSSSGKPSPYGLSHKNKDGEYDEFYKFCSSNSVDTCKCKYVKINDSSPAYPNHEIYLLKPESMEACLQAMQEYNRAYWGDSIGNSTNKVCAYITIDKSRSNFSESSYDPLSVSGETWTSTTSYCPYSYDTTKSEDSYINNLIRDKWKKFDF